MKCLIAAAMLAVVAEQAQAAPITYEGALTSGVTVSGTNTQSPGNSDNPIGANYWSFSANAGDVIDIYGDRTTAEFDMSFWVIDGILADTDDVLGGSFPGTQATFSIFGDDNDAPNLAGPFGDPHVLFVAPITGSYTVAVTNYASDTITAPYGYELTMTQRAGTPVVPEPTSLALAGFAGIGMAAGAWRRRRQQKQQAA